MKTIIQGLLSVTNEGQPVHKVVYCTNPNCNGQYKAKLISVFELCSSTYYGEVKAELIVPFSVCPHCRNSALAASFGEN